MRQTAIPYMQLRGGSSKGVYFQNTDLPADHDVRSAVLKWVVGAYGDPRQIDGLGGADPLTSKIAVVSPSVHAGCDIDFHFIQAMVGEDRLDDSPNCGNILAGVGAFALETGMMSIEGERAEISVFMANSQKKCDLIFELEDGLPVYEGDTEINGVMGTAAPVTCQYHELAGSLCGNLIPTGYICNEFDGVYASCIDNGMPVVCLRAEDFGIDGTESPDELNKDEKLKKRVEAIRLQAGLAMGLADVSNMAVPKMCLVSKAINGGHINTRTFIPKVCHQAIGVLGAVSVATAALFENSAIHDLAEIPKGNIKTMRIEHPSGFFDVQLELNPNQKEIDILRAGVVRTTRLISSGEVYVPASVWDGQS